MEAKITIYLTFAELSMELWNVTTDLWQFDDWEILL